MLRIASSVLEFANTINCLHYDSFLASSILLYPIITNISSSESNKAPLAIGTNFFQKTGQLPLSHIDLMLSFVLLPPKLLSCASPEVS